ncbi:hypothetical protein HanIR_Chr08g0343251 [Helianthus annuus]|nr:hypothetical protein HanIR_Chr08g0343251 [Helianthus annuus]
MCGLWLKSATQIIIWVGFGLNISTHQPITRQPDTTDIQGPQNVTKQIICKKRRNMQSLWVFSQCQVHALRNIQAN